MKKRILPTLLMLLLPIAACNSRTQPLPETTGTQPKAATAIPQPVAAQNFDYYLLNLSWSPEFCYSHPAATECAQHRAFTLHGLWPQNTNGTYPQNCSDTAGPADPAKYSDIYPDSGLLRHEWKTHGTCSGLAPDAFFALARQAVQSVAIPADLITLDRQRSMPPSQILDLFATANPGFPRDSLALSCGNNYLTAVEVCMNKTLQPTSCGAIRTCRANTVRIPPPQRASN
jgi:ribonuclease T2